MDIHQLRTFVAVAREGSITRASERLHLSQPAVSAHIKAIEDVLGLGLFARTPRGMSLTQEGVRLLAKAERTLDVHQELMDEATRMKGSLIGKLRLGAGSNSNNEAIGKLLTTFSERWPAVEVTLKHGTSGEILAGIRNGSLDAGFYNEPGEPAADLAAVPVSQFRIYLAAAPGLVTAGEPLDWTALAELIWIYPEASACCGQAAESLFQSNRIRPKRIISVDREDLTRTLITTGIGVGLLHAGTAQRAEQRGEAELLLECQQTVRILFAHLANRASDPLLVAATSVLRTSTS